VPAGSLEEIEIRAGALHAFEVIASELRETGRTATAVNVDLLIRPDNGIGVFPGSLRSADHGPGCVDDFTPEILGPNFHAGPRSHYRTALASLFV
jgi:hypothetical protein